MKPPTIEMTRIIAVILVASICLLSAPVGVYGVPMESEQQKVQLDYQETQKIETPSVFWMVVQMILALCLILVLAWGMIRIFGGNLRGRTQGRHMRVLDEINLGPNRGMVVVEVGGKVFIVGITDHQISMLGELDDKGIIEDMRMTYMENPYVPSAASITAWKYVKDKLTSGLHSKESTRKFDSMINQRMQALDRMSHRLRNLNNSQHKDDGWKNEER